ncbi:MAG: FAD-dependent thymidylate synthase [Candidatus Daviesbacteria bacterium]|nr:FAD-dependent thymidylate synthase [Candidatus Daviesbacteria bacterium]
MSLAAKARKLNPPLKEIYSKERIPEEEKAAHVALKHFVTDPNGAIYATTHLVPELFTALLKARYSRTELSAKQLLWREFVSQKENIPWSEIEKGLGLLDEVLNYSRAEGVAERILLQYGDDSVFELGGAHLFLDRVSMVASKVIEDARIGLSPLEKSTRYVIFDQKDGSGDYLFFKDPKIYFSAHKNLFLKTTRESFEVYGKAVNLFLAYYKKQIPLESGNFPDLSKGNKLVPYKRLFDEKSIKSAQLAYNQSIKAKACDVARVLLPASTLTNIGEFGNGRAYGYLFTKMLAMDLGEMQMIATEGTREIKKILPKFLDIVDNKYGKAYQEYLRKTDKVLRNKAKKLLAGIKPERVERVELVELDKDPEINIAAALLYPYANLPLRQLISIMKKLPAKVIGTILHDSLKFRTNRRHKLPRAYEIAGYELVFDILGNFGIYRDLHRQRMLTQQRQNYTTEHGFDMPVEFAEIGMEKEFEEIMIKMKKANIKVKKDLPQESQYLTTLANYTRWYMGMNLREAFWFTELRSVPQGHFSYRTIAQDMFLKASERYPFLKNLKSGQHQHVDMSDRRQNLERMEAMQRIQVKLSQIEDKYS